MELERGFFYIDRLNKQRCAASCHQHRKTQLLQSMAAYLFSQGSHGTFEIITLQLLFTADLGVSEKLSLPSLLVGCYEKLFAGITTAQVKIKSTTPVNSSAGNILKRFSTLKSKNDGFDSQKPRLLFSIVTLHLFSAMHELPLFSVRCYQTPTQEHYLMKKSYKTSDTGPSKEGDSGICRTRGVSMMSRSSTAVLLST